jgi:hypothetical protein
MLNVMFVENENNELKKVAQKENAFNIPNKMDFIMIDNIMYLVTDRMFDYDSNNVSCLVTKSENIKNDSNEKETEEVEED